MIAALIKYAINTANASVVYKNKLDPLNCFRVRFHFFSLTCISLRRNRLNFVKSGCRVELYGCKSLVLGQDIGKSHYPSARGFRFVKFLSPRTGKNLLTNSWSFISTTKVDEGLVNGDSINGSDSGVWWTTLICQK